jgi:hypothetical protein
MMTRNSPLLRENNERRKQELASHDAYLQLLRENYE